MKVSDSPVDTARFNLSSIARSTQAAFTLIEIVIVIVIIGLVATAVLRPSMGNFSYWEQESAIRKLTEQIQFLYHQAIVDGLSYRMEFNLSAERQYYRIGEISEPVADTQQQQGLGVVSDLGVGGQLIAKEIDNFLNPLPADFGQMNAPANIPSIAEPIELPDGLYIQDIRTMRGDYQSSSEEDMPYLTFSPRGYAEFTVIHLRLERSTEGFVTILVNPFTGMADIYREYKEFQWSYSGKT